MRENIYQNIDQPLNNPLNLAVPLPAKKDRRLVLLFILFLAIVVLLLASIIIPLVRKSPGRITTSPPSPVPTAIPNIVNPANIIPSPYQSQFKSIEENFKYNSEILPPQIDPQLGL